MTKNDTVLEVISPGDLMALGLQQIAYVKPIKDGDETTVFAIHAADGTQLAVLPNRDIALAMIRQNDLEPFSVH
ncbi:MAG: DUF1150 family protein [Planctomycetota bacterium]|nr:MAG: DUF1150 family protein [Planctomycetota bacterium]